MNAYDYHMPTRIVMGPNVLDGLPALVRTLGSTPLVVTGRHFARASGLLDCLAGLLPGAIFFAEVPENPTTHVCEAGAVRCRESGCDVVVAIGGGSAMDAAKAIALLATNPGSCRDYFASPAPGAPPLPIVAVPTTAGTGSETTPYAVLVDPAGPTKRTIAHPALFPKVAILDPVLSISMPRTVTVATGFDVLSQAMEGMLSRKCTPLGDTLALEICALVRRWLPVAAEAPDNLEARGAMLHAATLSGMVIAQSGTTLVHGMGYYYTLHCGVPHGLANALLLAPVFRVNAAHAPEKVARIAAALGFPCAATPEAAAPAITQSIHHLFQTLGVSPAAHAAGVPAEALSGFALEIASDPYRFKNQLGTLDAPAVEALFEASYRGV